MVNSKAEVLAHREGASDQNSNLHASRSAYLGETRRVCKGAVVGTTYTVGWGGETVRRQGVRVVDEED